MNIQLGVRENFYPFMVITLITAFIGGMVGIERTIIPILAQEKYGVTSTTATISFILSFGLTKGVFNFIAGILNDRFGRKKIEVLGWLFGLPVPIILIYASSWKWVVFANFILGINQALAWSTAVTYTLDIVRQDQRGLASGVNEFAGYLGVGFLTFITSYIGAVYGVHPYPMLVGIFIAVAGMLLSITLPESHHHVKREAFQIQNHQKEASFFRVFTLASFRDRNLLACSQGGFVANFTDGMAWGLLPLFLHFKGLSLSQIGWVATFYPMVWAFSQLATGLMSDKLGRKPVIVKGFLIQGVGIIGIALSGSFFLWMLFAFVFGLGKGMVYPTLIAAVSDNSPPLMRGSILGVYRLWRDWGYAFGALFSGIVADMVSLQWGVGATGLIAFVSAVVFLVAYRDTVRSGANY